MSSTTRPTSFTPKFMADFTAFKRERRSIRNLGEWRKFKKRWFGDRDSWPDKPGGKGAREQIDRLRLIAGVRDGRCWTPWYFVVDLSPEARHQYFWTLNTIGAPLENSNWKTIPRTRDNGWQQECGYCGIATSDLGENKCPKCAREMYYQWVCNE